MKCNNEIQRRARVRVVELNATFNNISVISWRSVLLVDETGENRRPVADKLDDMFYRVHLIWVGFDLTTLMMICTNILCLYRFLLLFWLLRHPDCCRVTYLLFYVSFSLLLLFFFFFHTFLSARFLGDALIKLYETL